MEFGPVVNVAVSGTHVSLPFWPLSAGLWMRCFVVKAKGKTDLSEIDPQYSYEGSS